MDKAQLIADLKEMIEADKEHLIKAVANGDRHEAHGFVDSIIDNQHELEDLQK